MVIYRKDGSVFTLKRPNPLVVEQNLWDGEKIILHNLDNNKEEVIKKEVYVKPISVVEKYVEPEIIKEPIIQKEEIKSEIKLPKLIKTPVHYLLAEINTYHDELYKETRNSITYKIKGSCEIAIINNEDLRMTFWTENKLTLNTIVYVPRDTRWWKINKIAELYECIPSDTQPSF